MGGGGGNLGGFQPLFQDLCSTVKNLSPKILVLEKLSSPRLVLKSPQIEALMIKNKEKKPECCQHLETFLGSFCYCKNNGTQFVRLICLSGGCADPNR